MSGNFLKQILHNVNKTGLKKHQSYRTYDRITWEETSVLKPGPTRVETISDVAKHLDTLGKSNQFIVTRIWLKLEGMDRKIKRLDALTNKLDSGVSVALFSTM